VWEAFHHWPTGFALRLQNLWGSTAYHLTSISRCLASWSLGSENDTLHAVYQITALERSSERTCDPHHHLNTIYVVFHNLSCDGCHMSLQYAIVWFVWRCYVQWGRLCWSFHTGDVGDSSRLGCDAVKPRRQTSIFRRFYTSQYLHFHGKGVYVGFQYVTELNPCAAFPFVFSSISHIGLKCDLKRLN